MAENVTQHSDLVTNLGEFGEKQTSSIAALRSNIEMRAVGFRGTSRATWAEWEVHRQTLGALEALEAQREKREVHKWIVKKLQFGSCPTTSTRMTSDTGLAR